MDDMLSSLMLLAFLLLAGLLVYGLSLELMFPDALLLLLGGIFLGSFTYNGASLIQLPAAVLISISILALSVIVFNLSSALRLGELDTFSKRGANFAVVSLLINAAFIPLIAKALFGLPVMLGVVFALIISGTSSFALPAKRGYKLLELLNAEAMLSAPLSLILPLLIFSLMQDAGFSAAGISSQLLPFMAKLGLGIGSGVVVAVILSKALRLKLSDAFASFAVIISALFAFLLAENIGGFGIVAVASLGIFIAALYSRKRQHKPSLMLKQHLTKLLSILVLLIVGASGAMPIDIGFFKNALALLVFYILLRHFCLILCFPKKEKLLSAKERLFMAFSAPKGAAAALAAFTLSGCNIPGVDAVVGLTVFFIIASIVLSSVMISSSKDIFGGKR